MIDFIKGKAVIKTVDYIVLEVNNIGYKIWMSYRDIAEISLAEDYFINALLVIKEDSLDIYGFLDDVDKSVFKTLININKVGPKLALAILSQYSNAELMGIISKDDYAMLSKVPKIGIKTAQKIIIDLKDKLNKLIPDSDLSDIPNIDKERNEAVIALMNLGYDEKRAKKAVDSVEGDSSDIIIREALKKI